MPTSGVSGPALAVVAGGAFLVYTGIKGTSPLDELRSILRGETPAPLSKESGFAPISVGSDFGGGSVGGSSSGNVLVKSAEKYLGKPYRWGATGPDRFDCSGLAWRAIRDVGINIPRFTTSTILLSGHVYRVTTPAVGDLVVWPGDHMGIISGNGQMIHAPRTGDVVKFSAYSHSRNGRGAVYLRVKNLGNPPPTGKAR